MRRVLMLLCLLLLWASLAGADAILNGGFEAGDLTGWSTIGDALAVGSSFGPVPEGGHQALISNGGSSLPNPFNPDNVFSFSGTQSVDSFLIDSFFGLPNTSMSVFF